MWEKGDFTRIADRMRKGGEAFVASLGDLRGLKIPDFGCGDGTTAVPAAKFGADLLGVAIARAVANNPYVLLADEPTGNLDPKTSHYVFDALTALVRQSGVAALIATHNHELAARMDRVVTLESGHIAPYSFD